MSSRPGVGAGVKDDRKPKLRFPAYQGAGQWTTETLGSLASISTERVGDKVCVPMSITSGVGLVSQEEKFGRVIAGSSYKNYLLLKPNDFAYNKSATKEYPEGFLALYSGAELAAVPNSIFTCFRINGNSPNPRYLNYLFAGNWHGQWLRKFVQVGARAHGSLSINDSDLLALPVPLPKGQSSLREQQKIADCLSSLEELIFAQARRVKALKTHKKGLIEQFFPIEGEAQPHRRFPEFRSAGDWAVVSIQELIDNRFIIGHLDGNHGSLYPRSEEFTEAGVPYISVNSFDNGSIDFRKSKYLSQEGATRLKKGISRDGDILFAHNATVGPVAKLSTHHKFVIISTSLTYFRCNQALLANDFLRYALISPAFVAQCDRVMSQSTRNQIPITTQRTFGLQIPAFPEQQRIADCITSLDDLIFAEIQRLDAARNQKRALMQQLFPSSEEMAA